MKVVWHIVAIVVLLGVFVALPFLSSINMEALRAGETDAVSSATAAIDAPGGSDTIFINTDEHPDKEVLADWETFFSGEDAPLIMEDITCVAVKSDPEGIEMAKSLQSRLPENRMTLRLEDGVLALSKAEAGKFDTMVMSEETANIFEAETLYDNPNVVVIHR